MGPKIERVFLEYRGGSIGLVAGENLVGRNIECRVRFNDAAVSRRHMRFMVLEDRLLAEDLGSSNGTWINEEPLTDTREIADGDVLEIGSRTVRVSLHLVTPADEDDELAAEKTENRIDSWISAPDEQDRHTRPTPGRGVPAVKPRPPASPRIPGALGRPRTDTVPRPRPARPRPANLPSKRICPRCRSQVPFENDACDKCSYRWPEGLPMTVTQPLRIAELGGAERRRHPRVQVQIPVIYNSDLLCFDAVARDLSEGGVFLATDLLDEPGTECQLTLLPDGPPALALRGVIRRIVQHGVGGLPGMGIEFVGIGDDEKSQLLELLERPS